MKRKAKAKFAVGQRISIEATFLGYYPSNGLSRINVAGCDIYVYQDRLRPLTRKEIGPRRKVKRGI